RRGSSRWPGGRLLAVVAGTPPRHPQGGRLPADRLHVGPGLRELQRSRRASVRGGIPSRYTARPGQGGEQGAGANPHPLETGDRRRQPLLDQETAPHQLSALPALGNTSARTHSTRARPRQNVLQRDRFPILLEDRTVAKLPPQPTPDLIELIPDPDT